MYVPNGILFPNCLIISFVENNFYFVDGRNLYRIGSTKVKVSRDEAIAIAFDYVKDYSFKIFMGDKPSIVVRNFTIVREKVMAELLS